MIWSGIFFSTAVTIVVVARLVILGILFLTSFTLALREVLAVAKLVILGVSFLTSFILALSSKLVISGILSSIFFILTLYTSFLTTSIFTTSLSLLKSTGTGTYLLTSDLSTLIFKLFETVGLFSIYQYLIHLHQILN